MASNDMFPSGYDDYLASIGRRQATREEYEATQAAIKNEPEGEA